MTAQLELSLLFFKFEISNLRSLLGFLLSFLLNFPTRARPHSRKFLKFVSPPFPGQDPSRSVKASQGQSTQKRRGGGVGNRRIAAFSVHENEFRMLPALSMNICITQYSDTAHRAGVIALWDAVFGHQGAHNKPSLAINKKLEVADGLFFVAILDQKVIGSVMAGYDGHRGWIYSVAVSPEHRRKGTGSQINSFCRTRSRKQRLHEGQSANNGGERKRHRILQEARLRSRKTNQHGKTTQPEYPTRRK